MESLKPQITLLLQHNEPPSEANIYGIRKLLAEPSKRLAETRAKVKLLDEQMKQLMREEETLCISIKPYEVVLAPIRRIPSDILHEVFFHCLSTHRNPIMDVTEAPILLTRVCRSWRSIALSSPRIWSKIYIPIPIMPLGGYYPLIFTLNERENRKWTYMQVAEGRSKMIKSWLDRSGECPLSISISYPQDSPPGMDDQEKPFIGMILTEIIAFSRRWRTLELKIPFRLYPTFGGSLTTKMLPMLEVLRLRIDNEHYLVGNNRSAPIPTALLECAKLRDVSLYMLSSLTRDFRTMTPNWHQIDRLYIHSKLPSDQFIKLLSQCHNLVEAKFYITRGPVYEHPTFVLPYLQTLIISDEAVNQDMSIAFRSIQAPALNHVQYLRSPYIYLDPQGNEEDDIYSRPLSIRNLLEASSIDTLLVHLPRIIPLERIVELLAAVPRTKHLTVARKRSNEKGDFVRFDDSPMGDSIFDPECLSVRDGSEGVEGDLLLPDLQILEVYQIPGLYSDEDTARMIKSRLQASKGGLVSALRMVKLHFLGQQKKDIKEDILQYAKELGIVDLNLEVTYAPRCPKHTNPLSSSYGLKSAGHSWNSDQIEESVIY
ncbi:hypothetical protein CVT25_005455 [Psilocybe cyanescens]|uniref:Uncharacterized protein n=1 Tax=Psilocybe cyanescens TaxID=93625 RepID=A0A409VQL5_PSICY|nr:hypothetical protein CVT25_005455 [Psilocybe cyanescens]